MTQPTMNRRTFVKGSLAASAMPEEGLRSKLINQQILAAFFGWGVFALLALTGLFGIWG